MTLTSQIKRTAVAALTLTISSLSAALPVVGHGVIPADARKYHRMVTAPGMVWPDGVTFNSDGYMYTGAAQLTLTNVLQADGVGKNKPPYLVYRFRPGF